MSYSFRKEAAERMAKKEEVVNPVIQIRETNPMKRLFTRALAASLLFVEVSLAPSNPLHVAADGVPAFRRADHNLP